MNVDDIRAGIPELNFKEVDETFIVPDAVIQSKIDEAVIFLSDVTVPIPNQIKEILTHKISLEKSDLKGQIQKIKLNKILIRKVVKRYLKG